MRGFVRAWTPPNEARIASLEVHFWSGTSRSQRSSKRPTVSKCNAQMDQSVAICEAIRTGTSENLAYSPIISILRGWHAGCDTSETLSHNHRGENSVLSSSRALLRACIHSWHKSPPFTHGDPTACLRSGFSFGGSKPKPPREIRSNATLRRAVCAFIQTRSVRFRSRSIWRRRFSSAAAAQNDRQRVVALCQAPRIHVEGAAMPD